MALIAIATGRRLDWIEAIDGPPRRVWAESGGPGDDIRLLFDDDVKVEVQVKKSLRIGDDLWDAMIALSKGVADGAIDQGLLVVCPRSSAAISRDLAEDLIRIGQGRTDDLTEVGTQFLSRLTNASLPIERVCGRLRIQTLNAVPAHESDIRGARFLLAEILEDKHKASEAWGKLIAAAGLMIRIRGAMDLGGFVQTLKTAGIFVATQPAAGPAGLLTAVNAWTGATNADFSIIGVKQPLSTRAAWIPIKAVVHDDDKSPKALHEAIEHYHDWTNQHRPSGKHLDPLTIGRFHTRAVVVAGPGMGKSTLMKRLALEYADEGMPVLRVALRTVAARMAERGESFGQAVFDVGLADSGVDPPSARRGLAPWVLLCDGLDECGKRQADVAEGLRTFALAHPQARLVVTTRPIGYQRAPLDAWRHYGLFPGDDSGITGRLFDLLDNILPPQAPKRDALMDAVWTLDYSKLKAVIARSPLLLTLAASLLSRGAQLGDSEPELYGRLIDLIENEPSPRKPEIDLAPAVRARFLEHLGAMLLEAPLATRQEALTACARRMATELNCGLLKAKAATEECAAHWEAVGIIERIWHDDSDALTFVHKTFGEFLAARDLLALDPLALRQVIGQKVHQSQWSIALEFGAALGAAAELIYAHYDAAVREDSAHHLNKAMALAKQFGVDDTVRDGLVDAALTLVVSEDRRTARRAAEALLGLAETEPKLLGARVQGLLDHRQSWTRLAAWCFAVLAGSEHYDLAGLKATLRTLSKDADHHGASRNGLMDLSDLGLGRIVESLALEGARQVLERCPASEADELLAPVLNAMIDRGHMLFRSSIVQLVKSFGRDYTFKPEKDFFTHRMDPEYEAASLLRYRRFLKPLTDLGAVPEASEPLERAFELAGFLDAVGFSYRSASDAWDWRKDQNPESLAATVIAVARLSGLNLTRLSAQAWRLLAEFDATSPEESWRVYVALPDVDHPKINWPRAASLDLDIAAIEPTLYHLSDFAVRLASYLVHGAVSTEVALAIGKRALETGRYLTLVAGVYLAQGAGEAIAVGLIHDRLSRPLDQGCEHLFEALTEFEHVFDDRAKASLQSGLVSADLKIAMAAAALALHYAQRPDAEREGLGSMVSAAYDHWLIHEPQKKPDDASVPQSPRETLLKASWILQPPELPIALALLNDTRSEICSLARTQLLERAGSDAEILRRIVGAIRERTTGGELIPALLTKGVSLDSDSLADLRALLRDPDPKQRYAVMNLLDPRYLTVAEIRDEAARLSRDQFGDIRAKAFSLIRRYESAAP